ncbi:plasmid recombination protein [Aeromonas veronii]|uniref:plasmid recombination protein n=1 Tax=Aeromonas veronii TaxID=654 RepID=UPI003F7A50A1
MSNFVIIRHKKLKSDGHVDAAIKHNDRRTMPPNADPSKTHLNHFEGGGMATLKKNLASVTQVSTAKNPVIAVEYIVTASPDQLQRPDFDLEGYFKAARAYLDKLVGAENLIHAAIHYDESNPHGHFIYTPIIELEPGIRRRSVVVGKDADGKQLREVREFPTKAGRALNGKKFTGLEASVQLQTDFAEQVGKPFGLIRGVRKSGAHHTEVKKFYGGLEAVKKELAEASAQLEAAKAELSEMTRLRDKLRRELNELPKLVLERVEAVMAAIKGVLEAGVGGYEPNLIRGPLARLFSMPETQAQPGRGMLLEGIRAHMQRAQDEARDSGKLAPNFGGEIELAEAATRKPKR